MIAVDITGVDCVSRGRSRRGAWGGINKGNDLVIEREIFSCYAIGLDFNQ